MVRPDPTILRQKVKVPPWPHQVVKGQDLLHTKFSFIKIIGVKGEQFKAVTHHSAHNIWLLKIALWK